jgi:nitronate monooxygenase
MVTGWPDSRFLELAGCRHPIVQAPMANAGGVELCVAAMQGGAVGSLPCGMLSPEQMIEHAASVRQRSAGQLNLNFLCHDMPKGSDDSAWRALLGPYYDEFGAQPGAATLVRHPFDAAACAVVEELRPEIVSFHFGLPGEPLLRRVKEAGAIVIATATTVEEARWLERRGVDAVIAQGFEAGGHSGRFLDSDPAEALGLFALVPQVVDAVGVPVIAAGGIGDGRGIAAALALGASAVQLGTAYLHCPESLVSDAHRRGLHDRPTLFTNLYTGRLARALRGRLIDELGPTRSEAPPYPLATAALAPIFTAAQARGEFGFTPMLAGQAGPLGRPLPAAELTSRLAADALAILDRAA